MKKPFGIILSAVVLCLAALGFFLLTATMVSIVLVSANRPSDPSMPHFLPYFFIAIGIIYLCLASWAILTIVGILRLRPWGRYSILAIGACVTFFSLMAIVGLAVTHSALPQRPDTNPYIAQTIFLITSGFEAAIAAIGIWWLVYFTRPRIRGLFHNSAQPAPVAWYPPNYPLPATSTPPQSEYPVFAAPPPPRSTNSLLSTSAPAAIQILGWLFLIGSPACLVMTLLPLPAFILGFIIPTFPSHLIFGAFGIINIFIGYGLLKLKNSARLTAIAMMALGVCNAALCVLPWYQNQFRQYIAQYMTHFTSMFPTVPGQSMPDFSNTYTSTMIVFNSFLGIAFSLFILWLLHRHRAAFTPAQTQTEA